MGEIINEGVVGGIGSKQQGPDNGRCWVLNIIKWKSHAQAPEQKCGQCGAGTKFVSPGNFELQIPSHPDRNCAIYGVAVPADELEELGYTVVFTG